jgi:hypothetical protein
MLRYQRNKAFFSTHLQTVNSNLDQELTQVTLVSGKIPQISTDLQQQPPFSGGLRGGISNLGVQ